MTMTRQEIINEITRLEKMKEATKKLEPYANKEFQLERIEIALYYLNKRLDKIDNK